MKEIPIKNFPIFVLITSFIFLLAIYLNYYFTIITFDHIQDLFSSLLLYQNTFFLCLLSGMLYCIYHLTQKIKAKNKEIIDAHHTQTNLEKIINTSCLHYFLITDGKHVEWLKKNLTPESYQDYITYEKKLLNSNKPFLLNGIGVPSHSHQPYYKIKGTFAGPNRTYPIIIIHENTDTVIEQDQLRKIIQDVKLELKLWQTLLEEFSIPIWLENTLGQVRWSNKAYKELYDQGSTKNDLYDADLLAEIEKNIGEYVHLIGPLADEQNQNKIINVNVNGQYKKYQFKGIPLKDENAVLFDDQIQDGNFYLGFVTDVTERESYKTLLNRHVAGQQKLFETLNIAIGIYGPDTKLDFCNQAYAQLWQLNSEWLEQRPPYLQVIEDIRIRKRLPDHTSFQEFREHRIRLFTSLIEPHEDMFYLPDGRVFHSTIVPHPYGGLIFIQSDVTTNLSMEGRYQILQAVQRETLNNMAEGIAVFGSDGLLKLCNPAYCDIFKLEETDFIENTHVQKISQIIASHIFGKKVKSKEKLSQTLISLALERHQHTGTLKLDGSRIIRFSVVPLPDGANLNTFLDITDSVMAAQNLKEKNAALKETDQFKSEFIAAASLNLKMPLNSIMGFSEILEAQYLGALNEKQREYLQLIREESQKILHSIQNILNLTSIEANKLNLTLTEISVPTLLNEVRLHLDSSQSKINLKIAIAKGVTTFALDAERIRQILFSLFLHLSDIKKKNAPVTLDVKKANDQNLIFALSCPLDLKTLTKELEAAPVPDDENELLEYLTDNVNFTLANDLIELHQGKILMSYTNQTLHIKIEFSQQTETIKQLAS
ncbi:MAG: PAS-domain containing protein [Alphaproteobacteria bacterium]|nr:PAS-domain containing protein [Alphaproteobacteria bacterium]MBP9878013.1 PAS-domain containing protein [Alphaproteobacteria bacterium]